MPVQPQKPGMSPAARYLTLIVILVAAYLVVSFALSQISGQLPRPASRSGKPGHRTAAILVPFDAAGCRSVPVAGTGWWGGLRGLNP